VNGGFRPTFIRPGDHIRVVAPSSPFDPEELAQGVARLEQRYRVTRDPSLLERHGYLAGDDARRSRELRAAIDDPSVRAIFAARGGYGATRLLGELELSRIARGAKLLVGFSDITALHAQWARAELQSVHGPMVAALGRADDAALARACEVIEGRFAGLSGLQTLVHGRVSGRLMGGNLAVLSALLGTPYMPSLEGAVLLLEDIGERPYRVDRMLTSLAQSGALGAVAGVVVGAFTDARPGPDGTTVETVLAERLGGLGIPVATGAPVGHVDANHPVPLGALVELDAEAGTLVCVQ
jgi:muramoyltetrapeptide carboxypeptidase